MADVPEGWEVRGKPPALLRRFVFERYADTRTFLDALAALAEKAGVHPQNISFGSTYVNITLEAVDGTALAEAEYMMAAQINRLSGQ